MKSGTLMRQVINKINEIDFNNFNDRHLFGDIYEQILRDLQSAGNTGEYYTPHAVTQFMVNMIDPKLGETILDPACSTGGFLICTLEHIRQNYVKTTADRDRLQSSISGVEKKPLPHLLCVRIEEFETEAWWDERYESDAVKGVRARAWKVSVQIKANNYNLDIKNPHRIDAEHGDLEEMLAGYQQLLAELSQTRNTLKQELMAALGSEEV